MSSLSNPLLHPLSIGLAATLALGAVGLGGYNLASADVSSGDRPVFIPINPCRLTDTRPGDAVGPRTSPLGAGETITVAARGQNGECTGASAIPVDAVSLSLNVTATNPTSNTFITIWGDGADPGTSNLNPGVGLRPAPNAVTTPLSDTGTFNVRNNRGSVNVIIDVNGYFVPHDHDDRYALAADLGDYALESDLDDYALTTDLDDFVTAADVPFVASGAVEVFAPNASVTTLNAPAGVTAAVSRNGVGSYTVTLNGLPAAITGIVQVTPFTDLAEGVRACSLDGTSAFTASTFAVDIQCFGRDGSPAIDVIEHDASFHFLITG